MKKKTNVNEPSVLIRPIGALGGLDNIHVALIVVVVLMFLVLLVMSYSRPILVTNSSSFNTTHSATEIQFLAQRVLASYGSVNSSLSLLPYITNVSAMKVTYMPSFKQWYVYLTAKNPVGGTEFSLAFLVNDNDTSKITPLLQTAIPSKIVEDKVVSLGVVDLDGKFACSTTTPTNVYWFLDPYAPGAIRSLINVTSLDRRLGNAVNITLKIVFGPDTQKIGDSYGLYGAQYLGKYLFCASQQKNFSSFVSDLNSMYANSYLSQELLANVANTSKIDYASLVQCLDNSTQSLNRQALLAQFYHINQTPVAVVNCHYKTIPQTAPQALCYANSSLC